MPRPFYIVDGYNLLHAAGLARDRYGPGQLERLRNRLLAMLRRRLEPQELLRTTVVFDAGETAPTDLPRQFDSDGMQILFCEPGSDADTLIEELIARHSAPRQLIVISSDRRLQQAARRRRGKFKKSEQFLAELQSRGEATTEPDPLPHPKYTGQPPSSETEHWLQIFGEFPELEDEAAPIEDTQFWEERVRELADEEDRPEDESIS